MPLLALLGALVVGGVLMAVEGVAPLSAYGEVVRGVFGRTRGLVDTAVIATPLMLLALGITVAYRARVFTIGAEGQYIAGRWRARRGRRPARSRGCPRRCWW